MSTRRLVGVTAIPMHAINTASPLRLLPKAPKERSRMNVPPRQSQYLRDDGGSSIAPCRAHRSHRSRALQPPPDGRHMTHGLSRRLLPSLSVHVWVPLASGRSHLVYSVRPYRGEGVDQPQCRPACRGDSNIDQWEQVQCMLGGNVLYLYQKRHCGVSGSLCNWLCAAVCVAYRGESQRRNGYYVVGGKGANASSS